MNEILSIEQCAKADRAAESAGVATWSLMRAAGAAVAREVQRRAPADPVLVLCGPGNNGGDGYVAAARLREGGRAVRVLSLTDPAKLTGDAALARDLWGAEIWPLQPGALQGAGAIVDALFGAGLTRPLEGEAAQAAAEARALGVPVIAADVPSGLHGDTGAPLGGLCFPAAAAVTFFRKKPAHVLMPGRALCGEVVVADIGIPESVLQDLAPAVWENAPGLWADAFPWPGAGTHKHARGRLAVLAGPPLGTGAARLAVAGGRRAGAGFTTLFGSEEALRIAAAHETGAVLRAAEAGPETAAAIRDFGARAAVLGPGAGRTDGVRAAVLSLLKDGPGLVLDADALTVFADDPDSLFAALRADCVLTPHEGEFARLFPDLAEGGNGGEGAPASKLARARQAAARAGCVVLLKGPDTVIAAPPAGGEEAGRAAVNTETSPFLASAGTGDVLAGMIGGLMAQGTPAFEAACAAAWLHGRAGRRIGPGLIAEDIPAALPAVLAELRQSA